MCDAAASAAASWACSCALELLQAHGLPRQLCVDAVQSEVPQSRCQLLALHGCTVGGGECAACEGEVELMRRRPPRMLDCRTL